MMGDLSPERLKAIQARSQADLIRFLDTDLDLAFTMLQTASIEEQFDPQVVPALVAKIQDAVQTVRSLAGRIQDRTVWIKILSRTDELDALLAEFLGYRKLPVNSN